MNPINYKKCPILCTLSVSMLKRMDSNEKDNKFESRLKAIRMKRNITA